MQKQRNAVGPLTSKSTFSPSGILGAAAGLHTEVQKLQQLLREQQWEERETLTWTLVSLLGDAEKKRERERERQGRQRWDRVEGVGWVNQTFTTTVAMEALLTFSERLNPTISKNSSRSPNSLCGCEVKGHGGSREGQRPHKYFVTGVDFLVFILEYFFFLWTFYFDLLCLYLNIWTFCSFCRKNALDLCVLSLLCSWM